MYSLCLHPRHYSKIKDQKLQVCALTGCASILLNCNARTLHSWSGIKLAKGTKESIIDKVISNRNAKRNWKQASILILDEVSMLSKKIFEIIEEIAETWLFFRLVLNAFLAIVHAIL